MQKTNTLAIVKIIMEHLPEKNKIPPAATGCRASANPFPSNRMPDKQAAFPSPSVKWLIRILPCPPTSLLPAACLAVACILSIGGCSAERDMNSEEERSPQIGESKSPSGYRKPTVDLPVCNMRIFRGRSGIRQQNVLGAESSESPGEFTWDRRALRLHITWQANDSENAERIIPALWPGYARLELHAQHHPEAIANPVMTLTR